MQKIMLKLLRTYLTVRQFGSSAVLSKVQGWEARALNKLMHRNRRSNELLPDRPGEPKKPKHLAHVQRRMVVLNKIFLDNVTIILSTCPIYAAMGEKIHISHVNISADFQILNIYWFLNQQRDTNTAVLEERLKNYSTELRSQLQKAHIMTKLPYVQFVKNNEIMEMYEVERRLAYADYGENYERNAVFFNPEHPVTYVENKDTEKECSSESQILQSNNQEERFSITLPAMRHDVFGLNQLRIMNKIQAFINRRSTAANQTQLNSQPKFDPTNLKGLATLSEKEQEKSLKKFLLHRKKQKYQLLKTLDTWEELKNIHSSDDE